MKFWFLRRMLRIHEQKDFLIMSYLPWQEQGRKLLNNIRGRQLSFLGHVIRKNGLDNLALTG